ncbi:ATP-binding protein [Natronogracilivirga saccharolytica]|uniref:AAA family ATPase n=1 Tax=Natronogracilivirga saccharolytica TaxID=2812953 RepID=A0A8J7RPQ4_9BACT|nr:ATP-binding protein [Natronogracilivirga saccharolytica]MBP3193893.1 AAA family ATPase [Natronogracilivirga saccharolytica]
MFQKAKRSSAKIKLAITGPSGSGKTYSALRLATGLAESGRIAVLDTENNSASLYADDFDFDVAPISPPFTNDKFVKAIYQAVELGYEVIILDSASHFWEGILEYKDALDKRGGNSFGNWADANKQYKAILDALLQSDVHLIACLRSKTEYVVEKNEKGKSVPRKIGLAPIMRDGVEYEFTTVFQLDAAHQAMADKDRTGLFTDKIFLITEQTGQNIAGWLGGGKGLVGPEKALLSEFEALGAQIYDDWEAKKAEFCRYISGGEHSDPGRLGEDDYRTLIDGMKRKQQTLAGSLNHEP